MRFISTFGLDVHLRILTFIENEILVSLKKMDLKDCMLSAIHLIPKIPTQLHVYVTSRVRQRLQNKALTISVCKDQLNQIFFISC